jgi:Putative adhesin
MHRDASSEAEKLFWNWASSLRVHFGEEIPMTRTIVFCFFAAALLAVSAVGQAVYSKPGDNSLEHSFASGGRITLRLSGGDYEIRGAATDKIAMTWRAKDPADLKKVQAKIDVYKNEATVSTEGPHNDFHVTIDVPKASDLVVRLSAGDLNISGISGSKDVESHAGDMNIHVGEPKDYGRVDASVNAGDLNAEPFGQSKGGLFRSFNWNGPGKYRLHVHLGAGDVNLIRGL